MPIKHSEWHYRNKDLSQLIAHKDPKYHCHTKGLFDEIFAIVQVGRRVHEKRMGGGMSMS